MGHAYEYPGRTVRAVLFDKDGTLFAFGNTWIPLMHAAFSELCHGDQDVFSRLCVAVGYHPGSAHFAADALMAAGNALEIAAAVVSVLPTLDIETVRGHLDSLSETHGALSAVPVCDLTSLFERLQLSKLRIGCATSDSEAAARATFARFDVEWRLDWINGYDSGNGFKPDPRIVETFAHSFGISPLDVMVVGDTWYDLRMARGAGALAVGVTSGASAPEQLALYADFILPDVSYLPGLLGSSLRPHRAHDDAKETVVA